MDETIRVRPTYAKKIGSVKEYVWMDKDALAWATALGTKGIAKYEGAIEGQRIMGNGRDWSESDSLHGVQVPDGG